MGDKVVELVNRTDKEFNFMHGGRQYKVPANESIHVTEEVAYHARKKSIMMYDLETGKATYQVGIKGIHDVSDLGPGKADDDELIDRATDTRGKPAKVKVRGRMVAEDDTLAR